MRFPYFSHAKARNFDETAGFSQTKKFFEKSNCHAFGPFSDQPPRYAFLIESLSNSSLPDPDSVILPVSST